VGTPDKSEVIQECGIGLVQVIQSENRFSFLSPELIRGEALSPALLTEVASVLNIQKSKIIDSKWIDNGPGWIGVLLSSAEEVLAVTPNRNSNLALGLFGFYGAESKYKYEVRGFYPEDGLLVEDPATGSLHASGAQWLTSAGKCVAPYLASQGKVINRDSEIYVTCDAAQKIWIGGSAEIRIKGEVTI
jgi:predicted PhzF superfamily epimerase YddE/YHI9